MSAESTGWRVWPSRAARGLWSCLDSESAVAMLGGMGFDYIAVDLQHGMLPAGAVHRVARSLRSTPTTCVVRVPWNRPEYIMQALDFGAQLVIVPMVDTPSDAVAAVGASAYPPAGRRSWGPLWTDTTLLPAEANASVGCLVMIETAEGFANVNSIAATPGLAGIYVGPNDLALALGRGRGTYLDDEVVHAAIESIQRACQAAGILAGLHCSTPEMAEYWALRGFSMLTIGTDSSLLAAGASALLNGRATENRAAVVGY